MTLSKKHYEAIAGAINNLVVKSKAFDVPTRRIRLSTLEDVGCELSYMLRNDNPRLRPDLFMRACGLLGTGEKQR